MWLLSLSLRNLFRQKRRSLFLGSAMAIGVALLVLANAFSNGLTDIMLNKILRWVTGHVTVAFYERGHAMTPVFRDRARLGFLGTEFKKVVLQQDEAIGQMVRAIGNGKADNIIYIGVDTSSKLDAAGLRELDEQFHLVEGKWQDLNDTRYENPVILTVDKARFLNVKRLDILRLRLRNVYGQDQSARVTVVGTMQIANIFMGAVTFGNLRQVKSILGYDGHSTGNINLVLKDPEKNAGWVADAIHRRLQPGLAVIPGTAETEAGVRKAAVVMGFNSDSVTAQKLGARLEVISGSLEAARFNKGALVAQPLARSLGLHPGGVFTLKYTDLWGGPAEPVTVHVEGIFKPGPAPAAGGWGGPTVLLQDERFYETFYAHWPRKPLPEEMQLLPAATHPSYPMLSPDWILLPRTATTQELEKKMKDMGKKRWRSTVIDVRTMYETAEQVLKLQGVLNLITLAAVLVLFAIILIGVINTLRMTIRERTREIGTVRAIGMQRTDVRNLFVLETVLLAFFAAVAGVLLAYLAMGVLSQIPMHLEDNPMGMFLVRARLYFVPTWSGVLGNMLLILVLAGATAFFPANRASRMAPGAALRHFE